MKVVYCQCSVFNPGGMERVLLNKVRWIRENRPDWELVVVTTDQQGRPPFYDFPKGVRMVDLGINYSEGNTQSVGRKMAGFFRKRRLHRKRLTRLLMAEKADLVVSLYPSESSFIPAIKDGSKKVLELHFNKYFRKQYGRSGLLGFMDRWRARQDERLVRRFDGFVVLTDEDCGYWGDMPNIHTIGNAALRHAGPSADSTERRVIAVGRLDYQKGFDRLVEAWGLVAKDPRSRGWRLDIFGQGEWCEMLCKKIKDLGIEKSAAINAPTNDIADEYSRSSILAMSSHFEGFPMVMIEAMSAGLPVATFDFKCGPRDIITDGVNGLIVEEGNVKALADALLCLMADDDMRRNMGREAMKVSERYSEERVMSLWMKLFEELTDKR